MAKKYTAQEAKKMILDTAARLFIEKGYEQTSISQIVAGLDGLSKGAVYYHFDSKHQIIVGLAKQFIPNNKMIKKITNNQDLNGLEKIQEILLTGMFDQEINESTANSLGLLADATFSSIYNRQMCQELVPVLEELIIEGTSDGSIKLDQATEGVELKQLAEFIILTTTTWFIQALFENLPEEFFEKLKVAQYVLRKSGMDIFNKKIMMKIVTHLTNLTNKGVTEDA